MNDKLKQARSWAAGAERELDDRVQSLILIAAKGSSEETGDQLGRLANLISHTEGERAIFVRAANMLQLGSAPEQVAEYLTKTALRGAEDQMANRGNDNSRAHHDGVLRATREMLDLLLDW